MGADKTTDETDAIAAGMCKIVVPNLGTCLADGAPYCLLQNCITRNSIQNFIRGLEIVPVQDISNLFICK